MNKRIFAILTISLLIIPIFSYAFSESGDILISALAKNANETESWSENPAMISGQNFDFLLVVKNNSEKPLKNASLEIEIPREISYSGYLSINGEFSRENIERPIDLGVLLPSEQKTVRFQAKSESLRFKEGSAEITIKVLSDKAIASYSMPVVLKPFVFQKIKLERKIGLATAGLALKQWYFWAIIIAALAFFFLRIFLRLFSSPMG